MSAILTSFLQCDLKVWGQNTIKIHQTVLMTESTYIPKYLTPRTPWFLKTVP